EVPITFEREGFARLVLDRLGLPEDAPARLAEGEQMVEWGKNPEHEVTLAIVGKYKENGDAYISVAEAVRERGSHNQCRVTIRWLEAADIEDDNLEMALGDVDGIIVTGGFGSRGVEGKIRAIQYARERGVPYLGLCLGLQLAVVEFARNV